MKTNFESFFIDERKTSVFIRAAGGLYALLGVQNSKFDEQGGLVGADPGKPMGGPVPNHNPGYYVLDEALKTGIRLHGHVTLDFLNDA